MVGEIATEGDAMTISILYLWFVFSGGIVIGMMLAALMGANDDAPRRPD